MWCSTGSTISDAACPHGDDAVTSPGPARGAQFLKPDDVAAPRHTIVVDVHQMQPRQWNRNLHAPLRMAIAAAQERRFPPCLG